jgi:hypothetical protein
MEVWRIKKFTTRKVHFVDPSRLMSFRLRFCSGECSTREYHTAFLAALPIRNLTTGYRLFIRLTRKVNGTPDLTHARGFTFGNG